MIDSQLIDSLEMPDYMPSHQMTVIDFVDLSTDGGTAKREFFDASGKPLAVVISGIPCSFQQQELDTREQQGQEKLAGLMTIFTTTNPQIKRAGMGVIKEDEPERFFRVLRSQNVGELSVFWRIEVEEVIDP